MYTIKRETEIALIGVAAMHPNTSIDELLLQWVNMYYDQQTREFESHLANGLQSDEV